jgi:predicted ester cyclase
VASTAEIARAYFSAQNAHDLDAAVALWKPGAIDRLVGDQELIAPDGIREYFGGVFDAFPDFAVAVIELTSGDARSAVRWRATGTFAGPGRVHGFAPTQAQMTIEGCDVLTIEDELIIHNDAYIDSGDVARQLGLLPPTGSPAQLRLAALANLRTRAAQAVHAADPERIADGVWVVRGGFPLKTFNVYLIEGEHGVTVFDAGIDGMASAILAAAARLGGIEQVVLGHADADHRGAAPGLGAPGTAPRLLRSAAAAPLCAAVLRAHAARLGRRRDRDRRHGRRGR